MSIKKVLMWITNPEYDAELLLQIQLRNPVEMQSCMNVLKENFVPESSDNRATITDKEICIHRGDTGTDIVLQPVCDSTGSMVSTINIILNCRVSYKYMVEQVFDLQVVLDDYKNTILKNFDGYPQKSSFTIDAKTDTLKQNCIKELILWSGSAVVCQQNRIELEGTVNMRNVQCMKHIMLFV